MRVQVHEATVLALILVGFFSLTFPFSFSQENNNTIYIRGDGSIEPVSAPILQEANLYTFVDNVSDSIVIERDNVVIDGEGHSVEGVGGGTGVVLAARNNVTVRNIRIVGFQTGANLDHSGSCVLTNVTSSNNWRYGIHLNFSSDNKVFWNKIVANGNGIMLEYSADNLIDGNVVTNSLGAGIDLLCSNNNRVLDNTAKYNGLAAPDNGDQDTGIRVGLSYGNTVSGNTIVNNYYGMIFLSAPNSVFSENVLSGNFRNFGIEAHSRSDLEIRVDNSNIVDGKRILYVVNSSDKVFDFPVASAYIIDSVNVTIRDIALTDSAYGIVLWNTNYSKIQNVTVTNNTVGITLGESNEVLISSSTVSNNYLGVLTLNSSFVLLTQNLFANNEDCGIYLSGGNNTVLHNGILNNKVYSTTQNSWDDDATGNYWSDYNGTDLNLDGIGETPHVIDARNQDNCPLIEPWSQTRTFDVNVTGIVGTYSVSIQSNSTTANLVFEQSNRRIAFVATGPTHTIGFCNVTIPKKLLDVFSNDQWVVTVNGEPSKANVTSDLTHTFVYFTYSHSTKIVKIIGTNPIDWIPPKASAGKNQTIYEGTTVTLDGSNSTDNCISPQELQYLWIFNGKTPQTLYGINRSYMFTNPGTYLITLNVTDLRGNSSIDTITITVLSIPVWFYWWFWALVLFSAVSLISFLFGLKHYLSNRRQKEILAAHKAELQARKAIEDDMARIKPKLEEFERKYGYKIQPSSGFGDIRKRMGIGTED